MPVRYPGSAMPWLRIAALGLAATAMVVAIVIVAMPGLDDGAAAAERDAIEWLQRLATAERQFRAAHHVDTDGDGTGEYAFLGELSGGCRLRLDDVGHLGLDVLATPLLPEVAIHGSVADDGNYAYAVFLPAPQNNWAGEHEDGGAAAIAVDGERAERAFRAYAWPLRDGSGQRAFALADDGSLRAHANTDRRYSDRDQPVPPTALDDDAAAWTPVR